ncbi:Histone deacetylase 8 [Hypsizygus marmoreus]|uniref:Histone deacetylase 8 n=1 Tax=Hypsizygus marmoreus TaxID=39966 RepID=A0A369J973_HYPMA|nr:Histone deacetylase 8 [Hypsizygus marmoreus]
MSLSVAYIASNELARISSLLPSNKHRSSAVHSLIASLGLLREPGMRVVRPEKASYKDMAVYHAREYLDSVLDPTTGVGDDGGNRAEFGLEDDCPIFSGLHDYVPLVAGASLTAARALITGEADIAISWDGGRHHAQKSHASGFCYVADCVLALMALKRAPPIPIPATGPSAPLTRKPRIMYIDLDLHFSDGVSQAFHVASRAGESQILTMSIHHAAPGFFPISPLSQLPPSPPNTSGPFDPYTLSLPLHAGASSTTLARAWGIVEEVKRAYAPDYVVLQCGADGLAGDTCAMWNLDLEGMGECVRAVRGWVEGKEGTTEDGEARVRGVLLLGGGGYNTPNVARAWASFTAIALGSPLPLDTPIPDHAGFPLYAPSFTLDVPAGTMQDRNSDTYLSEVGRRFEGVVRELEARRRGVSAGAGM